MEKKVIKFAFRGMNRDVSEGKHPLEFFYEANNIRFLTTNERITGGIAFEKGNELKISLPTITISTTANTITLGSGEVVKYKRGSELDTQIQENLIGLTSGAHVIIGHATTRDSIILFSTDSAGMDAIWEVDMNTYKVSMLYVRNLGFSKNNLIQAVYNFENDNIQKIYWVDGHNQIRFLNTRHSIANGYLEELININSNTINFVGNFKINQPEVTSVVSGGTHTSGMIQYGYNLYRLNSSQTKLSPLTPLIPLTKGNQQGGGDVNEIVGSTPVIKISNLDPEYTHIKVYAIKYTSFNELPSISLIEDQEISSSRVVNVFDDGSILSEVSLEQLLFLGSDPIIPKHIESKDNILFSANIKEKQFDVKLDARAYSFSAAPSPIARIYNNISLASNGFVTGAQLNVNTTTYAVPEKHDSINLKYDKYKYQSDGVTLGAEGKYIKLEVIQNTSLQNPEDYKFYKDNEVYRFGLTLYNRLGQTSLPKWMVDYRMPEGNLEGKYNTIKVGLTAEFYVWLNTESNFASQDDKPVGYKILRANRSLSDRTIISQGFLNGMMSNIVSRTGATTDIPMTEAMRLEAERGNKLPSLQRVYGDHHRHIKPMTHFLPLSNSGRANDTNEVTATVSGDGSLANTYQFNSMIQMFSPDVLFGNVTPYEGLTLRVKGALKNRTDNFWGQERKVVTQEVFGDGKVLGGLTARGTNNQRDTVGSADFFMDKGLFGPSGNDETMDLYQFYRDFTGGYVKSLAKTEYRVYKKPQVTEMGQGGEYYNGLADFKYYNTLQPMITDNVHEGSDQHPGITSVNSWGVKSITLVLGGDTVKLRDRPKLEDLYKKTQIADTNVMLVGELVKNDNQIYLGGIYGGNSFEDRKRTTYLEIGDYNDINTTETIINSGGDTFVQNFRFTKLVKTDTEVYSNVSMQVTEIVEGMIETDIDLKNRNDISLQAWDSRFQPRYEEYQKYNRVYSQEPTLVQALDVDYNFKAIKNFDGRIVASKLKTPGEYIDNWTDLLVNETIDLNGKFGPINALCSFKDQIYAFQDNAISLLSINPRVQTQGDDGLSIELGTGKVLHDYNYLSTTSGCINKWGIVVSNNGVYYLDALNKSIFRIGGQGMEGLSSARGLHKYLVDNINVQDMRKDNPVLGTGISLGYDLLNNDVYFTYNNKWTLCFNEKLDQFTGFYSYNAPIYIYTKEKLLTMHPTDGSKMYETHAGPYNNFYGVNEPSSITMIANPEPDHECLFTNLEWKSVAQNTAKVEQRYTWEEVRIHNEFQDSGYKALGPTNMRKLNRKYRTALPRNKNSTDRIRNNWAFVELKANNANGLFYLNQDIVLHYIANYIMLR